MINIRLYHKERPSSSSSSSLVSYQVFVFFFFFSLVFFWFLVLHSSEYFFRITPPATFAPIPSISPTSFGEKSGGRNRAPELRALELDLISRREGKREGFFGCFPRKEGIVCSFGCSGVCWSLTRSCNILLFLKNPPFHAVCICGESVEKEEEAEAGFSSLTCNMRWLVEFQTLPFSFSCVTRRNFWGRPGFWVL